MSEGLSTVIPGIKKKMNKEKNEKKKKKKKNSCHNNLKIDNNKEQ